MDSNDDGVGGFATQMGIPQSIVDCEPNLSNKIFKCHYHFNFRHHQNSTFFSDDDLLDIGNEEAGPGSDLDVAAPMCEKSEQHSDFHEFGDFDMYALPERIRHPAVVAWLWNCSALVVRLNNSKNATGRVILLSRQRKSMTCENENCPHRETQGPQHVIYHGLAIITNKHVVKSNDEAKRTRVEFFYNDPSSRQLVTREMGIELNSTNRAMDHTVFTCTAHSLDLLIIVNKLLSIITYTWQKIPRTVRLNTKQFAIVISHPHGTAKKISIGKKIRTAVRNDSGDAVKNVILLRDIYNLCEKNKGLLRFEGYYNQVKDITLSYRVTYYTAATCRGSSGAPVYMGNVVTENHLESNPPHTHRGVDPVEGYNVCFT